MSKQQRYTEEFKIEAVKQVTERHHPVAEVADRLGVSGHSLYAWIKRHNTPSLSSGGNLEKSDDVVLAPASLRWKRRERPVWHDLPRVALCPVVEVRSFLG